MVKEELYIFSRDELDRVDDLKTKIVTTPIKFLAVASLVVLAGKKFNLRRMMANPLKDESDILKNDKYWKLAIYNLVMIGTAGSLVTSFFKSEINKVHLYQKHEKIINEYMRWRTNREIKTYLLKEVPEEFL